MNQTDVIIIGGGVSGLMSARELAGAGARVVLLERQAIGKESSWAGGGILSPLAPWRVAAPITTLCDLSQKAYPSLVQTLKESTGIDPEWLQSGLLFCDCEETSKASQWASSHGVRAQWLSSNDVARMEPRISADPNNPLLLPDVAQIRNPRLLQALIKDLKRLGVAMLEQHPVDGFMKEGARISGVISGQKQFSAQAYVVTAGAWSGQLARAFGLSDLPIVPVKGEMLIFDTPPGLINHMVMARGRYLIPRKDGKILAGSTLENAQFNKSASEIARIALLEFAYGLLPDLRKYPIEKHWAGLRPGSPEGIPIVGAHPGIDNLYFNCGHYRNGFVMAPASARLLADLLLKRPPLVAPEPYLPRATN